MTEKTEDGGHAFPLIWNVAHNSDWNTEAGMSLRDYFAAQVMAAIIVGNKADYTAMTAGAVKDAYAVADTMLAERKK